ncbi:MAG: beta-lactamase family protein, partial [Chitinophagaceae bacterium]|nr:beta-lactamase family protein [Chitinophagaceae bacterium]
MKFSYYLFAIVSISLVGFQLKPKQKSTGPINHYLELRNTVAPLNSSILIGKKDTVVLQRFFGYEEAERKKLIDAETVFPIASGTKPFTAAAVLMLQDQKKLSIDDPLVKWMKGFPLSWNGITIRQLLSHTSGIPDWQKMAPEEKFPVTIPGIIAVYKNSKPVSAPGTTFSYGNINYLLLSFVIEKASGSTYEKFVESNIIEPLSLQHTGFVYQYKGARLAKGYTNVFLMQPLRDKELPNYRLLKGAGGMYSTPQD